MTWPVAGEGAAGERAARILVVDDVEANRDLLARRIRRLGHGVQTATNGQEALGLLRQEPPDLVFLDIMMPELNGYQVLEHMKADPRLGRIPVIMISAVDEVESIVRCIELGADDYLPKPFNPVILRARLDASLSRKRLHDREQRHAEAMARELEIGHNIQRSFLPDTLRAPAGYELAAMLEPARQVAGDFYDAFPIDEGRGLILAVGDVCDKGVAAALFMAIFRSLIRVTTDPAYAGVTGDDGERLLRVVTLLNNYIVRTHGRTNMFATLFLACLQVATGRLTYVNAGQDAPLLLAAGREPRRLEVTGPAVGLMPDMAFRAASIILAPGESLMAYTDGIPEGRSGSGEEFGEGRLLAAAVGDRSAERLVGDVCEAHQAFVGDAARLDDITMLALRRL